MRWFIFMIYDSSFVQRLFLQRLKEFVYQVKVDNWQIYRNHVYRMKKSKDLYFYIWEKVFLYLNALWKGSLFKLEHHSITLFHFFIVRKENSALIFKISWNRSIRRSELMSHIPSKNSYSSSQSRSILDFVVKSLCPSYQEF